MIFRNIMVLDGTTVLDGNIEYIIHVICNLSRSRHFPFSDGTCFTPYTRNATVCLRSLAPFHIPTSYLNGLRLFGHTVPRSIQSYSISFQVKKSAKRSKCLISQLLPSAISPFVKFISCNETKDNIYI